MKLSILFAISAAVGWPQDDDATQRAIAAVVKHEGKVVIDRDRPDHPVVAVDI